VSRAGRVGPLQVARTYSPLVPERGDDPDAMWKPGYVPPTRRDAVGAADATATVELEHTVDPAGEDSAQPARDPAAEDSAQPARDPAAEDSAQPAVDPIAGDVWAPSPNGAAGDAAEAVWSWRPSEAPGDDSSSWPTTGEIVVDVPRASIFEPPAPTRPGRRRAVLAGAAVAAVGVASVVAVVAMGGGDGTARAALPRVPSSVDVRWTASLPGERIEVVGVNDVVVVANADRGAWVTGLDASTGDERWSVRTGRGDSLGELLVVDDVVLVTSVGRSPRIRAIDPADGEVLWSRRVRADDLVAAFGTTVGVIGNEQDDDIRLTAIDPATGVETGTLDEPTAKVGPVFIRLDETSVEVFDERLERITGPVDIEDAPFAAAVVGDVIVSAGSGRLRATEFRGRERWVMDIGPQTVRYLVPSAASPGDVLLVSTSSITAVDTRGAEPVVRWTVGGVSVVDPSAPGTRYLPVSPGAGSTQLRIVDLRSGAVVSTVDTSQSTGSPLVGVDGLVLVRRLDDESWRLEARALESGEVTWTTELTGTPELVDSGVIGVRHLDGDGVELTYAGRG
jgi:PQQ-like domain